MTTSPTPSAPDALFPSGFFAKVPSEALSHLAHQGSAALSHCEFRIFVSLCRFRGQARRVNPTRLTLQKMTGMSPNNISRATAGLQRKGWLTIHYVGAMKSREVENYELHLPDASSARRQSAATAAAKPPSPSERHGAPGSDEDEYACYGQDDEDEEADANHLSAQELAALVAQTTLPGWSASTVRTS